MPESSRRFTVTELNAEIRSILEGSFSDIWVTGEISNFHNHPSSGHMYFTLKDGQAEMRCAMFRGANRFLRFIPENGLNVRVYGSVSVFEQRGQVQLIATLMEPAGLGDLFQAFEALKKKLAEEGLFNPEHKLSLPNFPRSVGVVTSGTGAAIRDILNVLKRRAPHVRILLRPTRVQGDGAARDIAEGIQNLERCGSVDVVIVGRGGGSLEDLWAFNEEVVARTIYNCAIPVISAVGHETDFTISDLTADLRAPTPSAAAELVSPARDKILSQLLIHLASIERSILAKIEQFWQSMDHLENRVILQQPRKRIQRQVEKLALLSQRLTHGTTIYLSQLKEKNSGMHKQLINLGPDQVLDRGYAIALTDQGQAIRSASDIALGDHFELRTGKGSFEAEKISDLQNNETG